MAKKPKILFVDDETNVVLGLQRMLRSMRNEWDMFFVNNAHEALEAVHNNHFDVIVSDMRMPEMDGADLFEKVMEKYPDIIRIILSGFSERELLLKTIKPTHQFLSKPCEPEILIRTIKRSLKLHEVLQNENIKKIILQMDDLPSLPSIYSELILKLKNKEATIEHIAKFIQQDPSVTAQILKLVNSSYFGVGQEVKDVEKAIRLLGMTSIKTLVLSIEIFSQFNLNPNYMHMIDSIWQHSRLTAYFAKIIAKSITSDPKLIETAFLAGFLHEIGILLLTSKFSEEYQTVLDIAHEAGVPIWEAEYGYLNASHCEIGAYLLGTWGFSDPIVESVALHHKSALINYNDYGLQAIVQFANAQANSLLSSNYVVKLGTLNIFKSSNSKLIIPYDEWQSLCVGAFNRGEV